MSIPNYIFIDDDPIGDFIPVFEKRQRITVEPMAPISSLSEIKKQIEAKIENIDGIIFDWGIKDANNQVEYSSPALAQDLANIIGESPRKLLPFIVLTGKGYRREIEQNETFHYLFNRIYGKDQISEKTEQLVNELYTLAIGYKKIRKENNTIIELVFNGFDTNSTILAYLDTFSSRHEKAIFIQNEVIITPGILISDSILAARLGIDKEKSNGWNSLLIEFEEKNFKYNGLFSEGWERWWFQSIEEWFYEKNKYYLNDLPAEERVGKIKEITGINELVAATPIEKTYSSFFWTICQITNKPLDPLNGFCVMNRHTYEWQDKTYISEIAALENKHKDIDLKLYPDEQKRLIELQEKG